MVVIPDKLFHGMETYSMPVSITFKDIWGLAVPLPSVNIHQKVTVSYCKNGP